MHRTHTRDARPALACSRTFALGLALAVASTAASRVAAAKDCGERPTGKNPATAELQAAIEELSMAFQVPGEIIKAVAHRESSVQQWRPDGSLVMNETDCGIGMMQLTGATAEEFDVERLKSEWRYNLEAGVTVLQAKWKRGLRTHWAGKKLPEPDPQILENWYYALSLYQGKRTGEYPGKVFEHLEQRPGRLKQLLAAAVVVSNPDKAIPGFAYGQNYTALPGNRIVLEDGRTLQVTTTKGTIGDPALLERADLLAEAGDRHRAKGKLREAIRFYDQARRQAGLDTSVGRRADAALREISAEAAKGLAEGKALLAGGDHAGALRALDLVERTYLGVPEAEEAARVAEGIRNDPELQARLRGLEDEAKARVLLDKAARAEERGRLAEALRALRTCVERYPESAAATEAEDRLRRLEEDPSLQEALVRREQERAVRSALGRAESYLGMRQFEKAIAAFEEVLRIAPDGPERERAREGIREARAASGR